MKKWIALLLALAMLLSLAACGGGNEKDDENEDEDEILQENEDQEEEKEEEETEPPIQDVTIGDYYVVFKGAYEYGSNEFGDKFIVFVEFTNNADQAYMPYTRVYIEVMQDGERMGGIEWSEKDSPAPDQQEMDRVELAPGETTNYYNGFYYNPEGGVITITIMDNFHTLEENLVVEINPADLVTYEAP